jgi:hypothetical protein
MQQAKSFRYRDIGPLRWILLILGLTLGLSGCAGNDQPTHTLENLEDEAENSLVESADLSLDADAGLDDELFDPFDEPGETQIEEHDPL